MPKILLDKDYFNYCEDVYATFQDIPIDNRPLAFGIEGIFTATTVLWQQKMHLFHVDETIPKGTYTLWIQVQGYDKVSLTISIGLPPPEQPVFIVDNVELPIPPGATHVYVGEFWLAPFAQLEAWLLEKVKNVLNAAANLIGAYTLSAHAVGSKLIIFLKEASPIAPEAVVIIIFLLIPLGIIIGSAYILGLEEKTRQTELELQKIQETRQTANELAQLAQQQYEKGNLSEQQYVELIKTITEKAAAPPPTTTTDMTSFFQNFLPTMMGVMMAVLIVDVFKAIRGK